MKIKMIALCSIVFSFSLFGCGSSKTQSASPVPTGRALNLFLTDSFRDDYDQVMVGITRVELLTANGEAETLYDNPSGFQIDARTLRDEGGPRYSLLSQNVVSARTFSAVRVTLREPVILTPRGSFTSELLPLSRQLARTADGRPQLTFPLIAPRAFTEGGGLALDIDLENFQVSEGSVVPAIKEAQDPLLNQEERLDSRDLTGAVLTVEDNGQPGNAFTLRAEGTTFTIKTGPATKLQDPSGASVPGVVAGRVADVRVRPDAATGTLIATLIRLYPATGGGR